jgi:predicted nucleic acid-binding protein
MRVLLDTSVLVAAIVEAHPMHEKALPWMQRAKAGTHEGIIAAHSIAELYSILTTLPVQPRIPPTVVWDLILKNVLDSCAVVSLSQEDYVAVIGHLAN